MLPTIAMPVYRPAWARPCAVLIVSLLFASAAHAQAGAVTLDAALQFAMNRSASIGAAQASVQASSEVLTEADQLPNPVLKAGIDNLPINGSRGFTIGQDILTMRRVGVEQEWVSSEKRQLRSSLANHVLDREQSSYLVQFANVRQQTALAWLNAVYAKKALALQQDLATHMSHELAATKASYRGADASALDVSQAHLMLAQTADRLLTARQASQTALIRLSRWAGTPVADVAGEPPVPESVVASLAPDQIRKVQPLLIAASSEIGVSDADTAVAGSNRHPNWTWGVSYLQGGNSSRYVSVGVSIPLAINSRHVEDRDLAAKAALGNRARLLYEDTRRQVQADIQTLSVTLANGRERVASLNRSLLPAARQRVGLAIAAYRSGKGTLADTFAAKRAQLDAQLQVLELEREVSLTWAQLDYQVVPPAMAAGQ